MKPKKTLSLPISVYKIYAEQAINNLATLLGNKFETRLSSNRIDEKYSSVEFKDLDKANKITLLRQLNEARIARKELQEK